MVTEIEPSFQSIDFHSFLVMTSLFLIFKQ
jgi:hypothetical protein